MILAGSRKSRIKVTDKYQVHISIEKFYREPITCDIVDMDKCHILLGRTWQHDVDATHKGRDNIYVFTWKGERVAMRPIPLSSEPTKKKVSSFISLCHQLDRNSRSSSYEERGTDAGERNADQGSLKVQAEALVDHPIDQAKQRKDQLAIERNTELVNRSSTDPKKTNIVSWTVNCLVDWIRS